MRNVAPGLALIAFAGLWAGMLTLLARLGGWAALAEIYGATDVFEGDRWRFQTAQMRGRVNYGNVLTVGASARGLSLVPCLPFRIAHPPLFIPWTDVSVTVRKGFLLTFWELGFRRVPGIPFRISERLGRRIAAAAGRGWPADAPHVG